MGMGMGMRKWPISNENKLVSNDLNQIVGG